MARGMPRLIGWHIKVAARLLLFSTLTMVAFPMTARTAAAADLAPLEAKALHQDLMHWTLLDARPKPAWQAGHIPGAHSFSWNDFTGTDEKGVPYRLKPSQDLATALARMGIDENTRIVVYGDADRSWGGEGWACWVLSWLGHRGPIRLLAGGIQSWQSCGYSLEPSLKKEETKPSRYQVNLRPELDIQASELEEKGPTIVLIDTRSTLEWLTGRIPNAIHIPWTRFYRDEDRRPLGPAALRKLLEDHGVDLRKPVVYYCTGGIRSGFAWAVHATCGLPEARNYEGGMEDWKRRSSKVLTPQ